MYYPKIIATDIDEPFRYLKSNLFVEHHELVTAVFYIKKKKKLNWYSRFGVHLRFTDSK